MKGWCNAWSRFFGLVVLEHGKFGDPQKIVDRIVHQAQAPAQTVAQVAQGVVDHPGLVSHEKDQIAGLHVQSLAHLFLFFVGKELGDGRLPLVLAHLDPGHAFGPVDGHERDQIVDLLARKLAAALGVEGLDDPAAGHGVGKDLEARPAHDVGNLLEFEAEAGIRLVQTIAVHGLGIGQAGKGQGDLACENLLEQALHHPLGQGHDVVFANEAQLQIDLGELGLAVGPQVLVAEAAHDLVVAVEPGDHQKLLEKLRRLGQGIELARVDAAGHQIVAGPFRGRTGQERGFDVEKPVFVQILAHAGRGPVAPDQVLLQAGAAQIDVAVLEAHVFRHVHRLFDQKGRGLGPVEDQQRVGKDLDLAGGQARIGHPFQARCHHAAHRDDVLVAQDMGLLMHRRVVLRVEDHLGHPLPVAQIDEDHPAVIAPPVHPAHQHHLAVLVAQAQSLKMVGSPPVSQLIEGHDCSLVVWIVENV